jgi:hypothetical protein
MKDNQLVLSIEDSGLVFQLIWNNEYLNLSLVRNMMEWV